MLLSGSFLDEKYSRYNAVLTKATQVQVIEGDYERRY
jgi:hypothetical protein